MSETAASEPYPVPGVPPVVGAAADHAAVDHLADASAGPDLDVDAQAFGMPVGDGDLAAGGGPQMYTHNGTPCT